MYHPKIYTKPRRCGARGRLEVDTRWLSSQNHPSNVVLTLCSTRSYIAMKISTPSSPIARVIVFSRYRIHLSCSVGVEKQQMILRSLVLQPVPGPALVINHRFAEASLPCPCTSTNTHLYSDSETGHQCISYDLTPETQIMGFGANRSVSTSDALETGVRIPMSSRSGCIVNNWHDEVACDHHGLRQ